MFTKACSIAWIWTSPPGVPKGMAKAPSRIASAGLGVSLGRLPGATLDACAGSTQDCEPREEGQSQVPGITGVSNETSLGVAEKTLPSASMAQT